MRLIIVSSLVLFLSACLKDQAVILPSPPIPPKDNTPYLEIKWERNIVMYPNLQTSISAPPHLYEGSVIINSEFPADSGYSPQTFYFMDTADGQVLRSWNNYIEYFDLYYHNRIVQYDNLLFLGDQTSINAINLKEGSTEWQKITQGGHPAISIGKDDLFKGADSDDWGRIWRMELSTGQSELVYHHNKEQGFKPFFVGIEHTVAPNGDELVIWKNWSSKGWTQTRTEFFCYNLTHDSLMWRSEQFMVTSNVYPPKRANDVVLGLLENSIVGIDLMTGQTLWETDLRQGSSCPNRISTIHAGIHVNQDRAIIAYTSCPEVVVINTSDGAQIHRWRLNTDNDYSSIEGKFTHYNGKLFFISQAELQVIDDYTGQPLFDPKRLNHLGGRLWNGVAIDSATQSMYIHNGQKLFCLRIPPDLR